MLCCYKIRTYKTYEHEKSLKIHYQSIEDSCYYFSIMNFSRSINTLFAKIALNILKTLYYELIKKINNNFLL
jgi:hypothetical protein